MPWLVLLAASLLALCGLFFFPYVRSQRRVSAALRLFNSGRSDEAIRELKEIVVAEFGGNLLGIGRDPYERAVEGLRSGFARSGVAADTESLTKLRAQRRAAERMGDSISGHDADVRFRRALAALPGAAADTSALPEPEAPEIEEVVEVRGDRAVLRGAAGVRHPCPSCGATDVSVVVSDARRRFRAVGGLVLGVPVGVVAFLWAEEWLGLKHRFLLGLSIAMIGYVVVRSSYPLRAAARCSKCGHGWDASD